MVVSEIVEELSKMLLHVTRPKRVQLAEFLNVKYIRNDSKDSAECTIFSDETGSSYVKIR